MISKLYACICLVFLVNQLKAQPTITSFSPGSGNLNTEVTIQGANFSSVAADNIVYFGSVKGFVIQASENTIVASVSNGATYQPVSVTTNGLTGYSNFPFINTFPAGISSFTRESFAMPVKYPTSSSSYFNSIGDLDGDGKSDLVVSTRDSGISLYQNLSSNGLIVLGSRINMINEIDLVGMTLSDCNGDGKLDIIAISRNSRKVLIVRNTSIIGSISFSPEYNFYTTGSDPLSVKAGDFDGDGKPDFVIANASSDDISIFRNTSAFGGISFSSRVDISTRNLSRSSNPISVSVGDLDGDGKTDISVANYLSNNISIFRNTSSGGFLSFAPKADFETGVFPNSVVMSDLDKDGKLDLAVANSNSNTLSIYKNTSISGSISLSQKIDYSTGIYPATISIGDLDGDTNPDIAVTNGNSNNVSIFKNLGIAGSISFIPKVDYNLENGSYSIEIGDLSGDSKSDLILNGGITSSISILRNTVAEPVIVASGTNPITGFVSNKLTIDTTVQNYNGTPYVQRHYDIEPINNASTATATITLYFLQQEFDNYNAYPGHGLDLPSNPNDIINKANLKIYQYHGFSASSTPGTYSGSTVEINPDDNNIIWNDTAQRWEITFDVNGFSGFFAGTTILSVLPLKFMSFTAIAQKENILLDWMASEEINLDRYEIQRSTDTRIFTSIATVAACKRNCSNSAYQYIDKAGIEPVYYYRLKMTEIDGRFTYSSMRTVKFNYSTSSLVVSPNPATGIILINHPAISAVAKLKIFDMAGRLIKSVNVSNNSSQTQVEIRTLTTGIYKIEWMDESKKLTQTLIVQ